MPILLVFCYCVIISWSVELKILFFLIVEMAKGDHVSLHVDLDGKCRKGSKVKLEEKKYFVGNGIADLSRSEIFQRKQPRYIYVVTI